LTLDNLDNPICNAKRAVLWLNVKS